MNLYGYILVVKIMYTVLVLSWFSYYDIKYRDIPDRYVWLSLIVSIILFIASIPFYLGRFGYQLLIGYTVLSILLSTGFFAMLYFMGFIGLADVFVVSEIALLFPLIDVYDIIYYKIEFPFHLPPVLPIILYSTISSLIIMLFKSLFISIKHYDKLPQDIPLSKKIALMFMARPMTIRDFLSTKYYYPLTIFKIEDNVLKRITRLTFDVEEEEYWEYQEEFRKLVEEGLLSPDEYVWVTYGVPYMVPLLIGFILFLILGDTPFFELFS